MLTQLTLRLCSGCRYSLPLDAFSKNAKGKDGLRSLCKTCDNERSRARYAADPTKAFLRHTAWARANRGKLAAAQAERRKRDPDKARAHDARYRLANPDKVRAKAAAYHAANLSKERERGRAYKAAHPEKGRTAAHVRRARLRGVESENVSLERLFERDKGICGICGKRVFWNARDAYMRPSLDHIIPVSREGPNTYANAQLAHRRCNAVRGNRGPAQLRLAV